MFSPPCLWLASEVVGAIEPARTGRRSGSAVSLVGVVDWGAP
jgi:hypothetical protein